MQFAESELTAKVGKINKTNVYMSKQNKKSLFFYKLKGKKLNI